MHATQATFSQVICRLNRDTFSMVQAAGFEVTRRVQLLDGLAEEITAVRVKD